MKAYEKNGTIYIEDLPTFNRISEGEYKYELIREIRYAPKSVYWRTVNFVSKSRKIRIMRGVITLLPGFKFNGLTHHKDHLEYLVAAAFHDGLLEEGRKVKQLHWIKRDRKDRVFYELMLEASDTRYKRFKAWVHYAAVCINTKFQSLRGDV